MTNDINDMLMTFSLYTTKGCHLCENARADLQIALEDYSAVSPIDFEIEEIDVFKDDMFKDLRDNVPIIESPTGDRLMYPFTNKDITQMLISLNV